MLCVESRWRQLGEVGRKVESVMLWRYGDCGPDLSYGMVIVREKWEERKKRGINKQL